MSAVKEFITGSGARRAERDAAERQAALQEERRQQDIQSRAREVRLEDQRTERERSAKRLEKAGALQRSLQALRSRGVQTEDLAQTPGSLSSALFSGGRGVR